MGKSDFLWKLFRKAVTPDSDEGKENPTPPLRMLSEQEPRVKVTLYISSNLHRTYKHIAIELNTTVSLLTEEALAYYLEEKLKKEFPGIAE